MPAMLIRARQPVTLQDHEKEILREILRLFH